MAGFYPDAPNNRIAYDVDGTVLSYSTNGGSTILPISAGVVNTMNNDSVSGAAHIQEGAWEYRYWFFPRKMDITHIFQSGANVNFLGGTQSWSPDSTNGVDGTWNNFTLPFDQFAGNAPAMRNNIRAVTGLTGVKVLRLQYRPGGGAGWWWRTHLYGRPSSGEDLNRLELWHPTLDERVGGAYFDWGDSARATSATRQFRVKNLSSSLTANAVTLSTSVISDLSPAFGPMHTYSSDGTTFTSTLNIGDLAPGAVSGALHIKRDLTSSAALAISWARIRAVAGSWT